MVYKPKALQTVLGTFPGIIDNPMQFRNSECKQTHYSSSIRSKQWCVSPKAPCIVAISIGFSGPADIILGDFRHTLAPIALCKGRNKNGLTMASNDNLNLGYYNKPWFMTSRGLLLQQSFHLIIYSTFLWYKIPSKQPFLRGQNPGIPRVDKTPPFRFTNIRRLGSGPLAELHHRGGAHGREVPTPSQRRKSQKKDSNRLEIMVKLW